MTLMKAKKPLALLLALLAALSLLGTTALAAGLPEETIAAQTELCGEDCGHTHEEVFSHTEHAEESLPELCRWQHLCWNSLNRKPNSPPIPPA